MVVELRPTLVRPATRVEHDAQWRYLIGEPVSDPATLAAHAHRMAPHEVLVRYPAGLIPEIDHL